MSQLATLIAHQARYRPDHTAVVFENERFTYREFGERVARCADVLQALGVRKGDRVATLTGNCRELLEVYWAAPALGAALVPLSPLLTAKGIATMIRDAGAKCLVAQQAAAPAIDEIRGEVADLLGDRLLLVDSTAPGYRDYAALTAEASSTFTAADVSPDDVFNIIYSSGTTGAPKGIVHTHRIRTWYHHMGATAFRVTPESVVLQTGALVFNGAFVMLLPAFCLGATYVLARQFDPDTALALIEHERVTHMMMVPSQIVALINSPNYDPQRLASLECILSLGAPLLAQHKNRLTRDLPGRFYELYGLTEGFITILDKTQAERKAGSVGTPPLFFDMRIAREDGADAAVGEVGEIVGRGPILTPGYYNRPDLTSEAIRDGWLHTGDMGYVDEEGYLYLVDRKKDMIDTGGVKVYPRDIEELAIQHPAVRDVAVFGVPHEKWGETPLAAVVLKQPGATGPDAIKEWINSRVSAKYQRVSEVVVMDDFPRSAAGKTLKREMRAPYWRGTGRKI